MKTSFQHFIIGNKPSSKASAVLPLSSAFFIVFD
jgi:hypothetical protein